MTLKSHHIGWRDWQDTLHLTALRLSSLQYSPIQHISLISAALPGITEKLTDLQGMAGKRAVSHFPGQGSLALTRCGGGARTTRTPRTALMRQHAE